MLTGDVWARDLDEEHKRGDVDVLGLGSVLEYLMVALTTGYRRWVRDQRSCVASSYRMSFLQVYLEAIRMAFRGLLEDSL